MIIDTHNPCTSRSYNAIPNQDPMATHNGPAADNESAGMTETYSITISGTATHVVNPSVSHDTEPMLHKLRVAELKYYAHSNNYPVNPERTAEIFQQLSISLQ